MTQSPTLRSPRSEWFWNMIAKNYSRQAIADETSYQHKLALTQSYFKPDMRVLEFGCGTGSTALIHAPHVSHIDGIDYSSNMVEIANGKVRDSGPANVAFHQATIESWPVPDDPYDVVMGMSILHLLQNHRAVLKRVRDMLPVGGLFFSSTVCLGDMKGVVPKVIVPVASRLRILPHLALIQGHALLQDIEEAGFEIDQSWRPGPDSSIFVAARAV